MRGALLMEEQPAQTIAIDPGFLGANGWAL